MAIWLGITASAASSRCINTNLRGPSLAHCIDIVAPQHIIVAAELDRRHSEPRRALHAGRRSGCTAAAASVDAHRSRDRALFGERRSRQPSAARHRSPTARSTSTPPAPPACRRPPTSAITALMQWSHWFAGLMDTQPDDRMYDCLPMYHSVGGVVATGAALVGGGSVVIRERFSARGFWDDIARWDCTLFQYIGELCRYLVNCAAASARARASAAAGLRQRPARRRLGGVPDALRNPADPRILRRHRRQFLALQRRGQGRRDRPRAGVPRAPLPAGAGAVRCRRRASRCATPTASASAARPTKPARRSAGSAATRAAGGASRATPTRPKPSERSCATCSQPGDAWYRTGDLMRKDARGFYLFRRPHRRHLPLEGRERGHLRSRRGASRRSPASPRRASTASRCPAPRARRHGGARRRRRARLRGASHSISRAACRTMPGRCSCASGPHRRHRDVQAEEERPCAQGFDPAAVADPIYFDDPGRQAYVRLDAALYERIATGKFGFRPAFVQSRRLIVAYSRRIAPARASTRL